MYNLTVRQISFFNALAILRKDMADVNMSGSNSEVDFTSMIPSSDQHNRCREALENAGAGVNIADGSGNTPLMFAVKENHTECVNTLIKAGANVNIQNKEGETAVNLTAMRGSVECLKDLLAVGADVNIANDKGDTPLITLAHFSSNENFAAALIDAGANVNHSNKDGRTALMKAAPYHENIVHVLLAEGADVNMKDKNSKDALHHATCSNKCRSIDILLKAGADVNRRDETGWTPLITAAWHACHVSESESAKCLDMLIKAGADVNAKNSDGETALIFIALYDLVESVKALIEAGADVNAGRSIAGRTALFFASESKCVDVLLEAGADVNITDDDGNTALHLSVHLDDDDDDGDDDDKDYVGYNIFWHHQNVKRLLRAGIHINKFNTTKSTNALETFLDYKDQDADPFTEDSIKILYAAGETIDGSEGDEVLQELQSEDEKLELKNICREAIRKHLLKLDLHSNLFSRIPELGLPSILTEYLLYNQSLDDDDDEEDDDKNDDDHHDDDDIDDDDDDDD